MKKNEKEVRWRNVKSSPQHGLDFGEHRRRVEVSRKPTAGFPLLVLLLGSKYSGNVMSEGGTML